MSSKVTLFWFRQDLRLSDNPGLFEAAKNSAVLPIYILDDKAAGEFKMGSASRWWLHHSLKKLNDSLDDKLRCYSGDTKEILLKIIKENSVNAVYWNRCYEPWRIQNDTEIKALLKKKNVECESFNGSLLREPWKVLKEDGAPYKVYTAFYKKAGFQTNYSRELLAKPKKLILVNNANHTDSIDTLELLPSIPWDKQIKPHWKIGEKAAQQKLHKFLDEHLLGYKKYRDYPAKPNVSRLSPHLHFGEISPNQVLYSVQAKDTIAGYLNDIEHFIKELAWREFSYYLLYHFPDLPRQNLQSKFDQFPWEINKHKLEAWQKGQTGYPIIDAGMRELWQTGYMHNRVRMIVGSFLVKNCRLHWHEGENWFWDCLVDADLANNSASWQWIAGSGADAAPYFRIFNPVTQGEKFDPEGEYTRRFVPELTKLPNRYLFKPWEAPEEVLNKADVRLGQNYPRPIVDLKESRAKALEAYYELIQL